MKINKIDFNCDDIGIISTLTFFSIFWFGYNKYFRPSDPSKKHLMSGCVFNIPKKIQPFCLIHAKRFSKIQQEKCLDKWSIGHIFIYFISGLFFPKRYLFVLLISIFCEIFEYYAGFRGRISDLFVNLFGYIIGSLFHNYFFKNYREKFCKIKNRFLFCIPILIILLILLYVNRNPNWV